MSEYFPSSLLEGSHYSVAAMKELAVRLKDLRACHGAIEGWRIATAEFLTRDLPFAIHREAHRYFFSDYDSDRLGPGPLSCPSESQIASSNIMHLCKRLGLTNYEQLRAYGWDHKEAFLEVMLDELGIVFQTKPRRMAKDITNVEDAGFLDGGVFNITESCIDLASENPAIIFGLVDGSLVEISHRELNGRVNRIANALLKLGFCAGDAIGIYMPMTADAVAIYLAIIRIGCSVVSIADSFAPPEIRTRLEISGAKAIFTQQHIAVGDKRIDLYSKVIAADGPRGIVIRVSDDLDEMLRDGDLIFDDFLGDDSEVKAHGCDAGAMCNLLFSSGTTGVPKAIAWSHTTPLKCAVDGYIHHDIHDGDVVAWPTNLGWMMGPWVIYASLINGATLAIYEGSPSGLGFASFVERAKVTMLGLVPSLIKHWRKADLLSKVDWRGVKVFSSTGECSNADDMHYLSAKSGYQPMIEYCGGTEIGGGYVTGTVVEPQAGGCFSTVAVGLRMHLLDEGFESSSEGEVFLEGPAIGLSTRLLNGDHHEMYFAESPRDEMGRALRRHGDAFMSLGGGYFCAQGRADDTMNLGGIKTSSAEIERGLGGLDFIEEVGAVGVKPAGGGPSELHVFVVLADCSVAGDDLLGLLQKQIKREINPLFKISKVHLLGALPRTASHKIIHKQLKTLALGDK